MQTISMQEAARMLADNGYTIQGGNFDTLDDFISYYESHARGAGSRFLVEDLEALFGVEFGRLAPNHNEKQ